MFDVAQTLDFACIGAFRVKRGEIQRVFFVGLHLSAGVPLRLPQGGKFGRSNIPSR